MKSYPISFARATAARASISHSATYSGPGSPGPSIMKAAKTRGPTTEPLRISSRVTVTNSGDASPMLSTVVTPAARNSGSISFRSTCVCMSAMPGIKNFSRPPMTTVPRRQMHEACGTDVSDLAAPNEDSLVREDAFRVHWNYRNILECNWPVAGCWFTYRLTLAWDCQCQNRQGSNHA